MIALYTGKINPTFVGFFVYGMMGRFGDGENSNYLSNIPLGLFNLIFISPL